MKRIMMFFILLIAPMLGSAFAQEAAGVMGATFTGKFFDSEYLQTQGTGESTVMQTTPPAESRSKICIYPILVQAPIFGSTIDLPSRPDGGGGGGGAVSGKTDSHLDGLFMAGFTMDKGKLYIDFSGLWGSLTADRTTRPLIKVDTDATYVDLAAGWRFYHDLAITGGFRYLGVKVNVEIQDIPRFETKPHLWDPLIGVDWRHYKGDKWIFDANFQGGGFGVGSEVDLSAEARVDWMFARHFGVQFGYGILHYKIKVADVNVGQFTREVDIKQTLNGPKFGLGIYF